MVKKTPLLPLSHALSGCLRKVRFTYLKERFFFRFFDRFLLTKSPESAPWLDQRETSIAIYRIRNDTKIKVTRQISKKNITAAMTDPKVYLFMAMNLIMTIPSKIFFLTRNTFTKWPRRVILSQNGLLTRIFSRLSYYLCCTRCSNFIQ